MTGLLRSHSSLSLISVISRVEILDTNYTTSDTIHSDTIQSQDEWAMYWKFKTLNFKGTLNLKEIKNFLINICYSRYLLQVLIH